jgi:hypothetical protein
MQDHQSLTLIDEKRLWTHFIDVTDLNRKRSHIVSRCLVRINGGEWSTSRASLIGKILTLIFSLFMR